MKIPRIIHQTWKDKQIPDGLLQLSRTWTKHHPDWEYRLWTDEDNHRFIAEHFPGFLSIYEQYPTAIQRVDAVRYLILYLHGGVFVDLDFACTKNMEYLLQPASCVFGQEPLEHCEIHEKPFIISNAFMASVPQHPFLLSVQKELYRNDIDIDHRNNRVLETTGPFMLSRVYNDTADKEAITLLHHRHLFPLTKSEITQLLQEPNAPMAIRKKLQKAYAVHYYIGSWWDKNANLLVTKIKENTPYIPTL